VTLSEITANCDKRANGCLMWRGSKDRDGYAQIRDGDRVRQGHVLVWEMRHGRKLPAGSVLDHLCDHRACLAAAHLKRTDQADNLQRAGEQGHMDRYDDDEDGDE